jgi:hypothetical protein
MTDKIIKMKDSPQSINTIDQDGDNMIGGRGKIKNKSWWERTKWLRWILLFIVSISAVIISILFNN